MKVKVVHDKPILLTRALKNTRGNWCNLAWFSHEGFWMQKSPAHSGAKGLSNPGESTCYVLQQFCGVAFHFNIKGIALEFHLTHCTGAVD